MVTLLLRVLSHSAAIQPLLDIPTTRGSVQSVFPRAANLLFGGRLLTLLARETPCTPNGLVLPLHSRQGPLADLQVGMAVIIERGMIHVPPLSLRLSTQNSRSWNPHPHLVQASCPPERLAHNVTRLATLVATKAPSGGLSALARLPGDWASVQTRAYPLSSDAPAPADASLLLHTARPATEHLLEGIIQQHMPSARQGASALIGLGPGLTPSGDDVVIGLMAATILLSEALGIPGKFYQRLNTELLAIARTRTNKLSITWMEYARQGDVAEHLGRLFQTLVSDDSQSLEDAAMEVLDSGATSGGDLLTGVILGSCCLIARSIV